MYGLDQRYRDLKFLPESAGAEDANGLRQQNRAVSLSCLFLYFWESGPVTEGVTGSHDRVEAVELRAPAGDNTKDLFVYNLYCKKSVRDAPPNQSPHLA